MAVDREPGAMARTILGAHFTGMAVADQIAERIEVKVEPVPKLRTYIDRRANVKLPIILFDEAGSGTLKELIVKSELSSYKVIITVDGLEVYNNKWDWFYSNSQAIKEIAAFQEDSTYILSIADVKFSRSLRISLRPLEPFTMVIRLVEVFLKVDISR